MSKIILIAGTSLEANSEYAMSLATEGHTVILLLWAQPSTTHETGMIANLEIRYMHSEDPDRLQKALQQVRKRHGAIDVLINHVTFSGFGTLEVLSEPEMKKVYEETFWNTVRLYKELLPEMRIRHTGVIINLLYGTEVYMMPPLLTYESARAAIEALTTTVRYENRKSSIELVNLYVGKIPRQVIFDPLTHCNCPDFEKSHLVGIQGNMEEYAIKLSMSQEHDQPDMAKLATTLIMLLAAQPGTRPTELSIPPDNDRIL